MTPRPAASHVVVEIRQPAIMEVAGDTPPFNQDEWPHWVDEDGDCQNTRNEVLIQQSVENVTFVPNQQCDVISGRWLDPFTGILTTEPDELDISPLVPLMNAHVSGGWAWGLDKKEAYANDLKEPEHLIAVTSSANRAKGPRAPDEWRPPNQGYWCDYARGWIRIKNNWGLTVTQPEWAALSDMLDTCPGGGPTIIVAAAPVTATLGPASATPIPPAPTSVLTATPSTFPPSATPEPATMTPTSTETPAEPTATLPPPTATTEPTPNIQITEMHCEAQPEWVLLFNDAYTPQDMTGWRLHDEGEKRTFPFRDGFILPARQSVRIWSYGDVPESPFDLNWGRQAVWDNDGDTAYLYDRAGNLVVQRSC